jgi:pseudouridine kinase
VDQSAASEIVCIGGAAVDRKYRARRPLVPETSNPVTSEISFGGVARNVAENLSRLGVPCSLVSVLGDDENGRSILQHLTRLGIGTSHVLVLRPNGDLAFGLADMAIFDTFVPSRLRKIWPNLSCSGWLFADCNLPSDTLHALLELSRSHSRLLAVDAVSVSKAGRLPHDLHGIEILFLNRDEAQALTGESLAPADAASALVERGANRVVLTCGADGMIVAEASGTVSLRSDRAQIVDATGAGDALIAGTLAGLARGLLLADAARSGMIAARLTLAHSASVRPDLSPALLDAAARR